MKAAMTALAMLAAPCTGPVCNFDTLRPYVDRLEQARDRPVHILQIGDSHTAGDVMTSAWRALLQAQWGDGGRGVLPPGRPYAGYITHDITAAMSPGWRVATTFGAGSAEPRPPLGLASYTLTSTQAGATIALASDPGHVFDRFVICMMAGPGAGAATVRMTGLERHFTLAASVSTPRCETIRSAAPQSTLSVTASDAPVTITSWATFRDDRGITLSNLGVIGSQLAHFGRTDNAVLTEELRGFTPDLIVLAFGTNEGFAPHFDALAYEATLRAQVARLRRLAPGVPLLLLGPPDALTRNPALRDNAPGIATMCADPALLFAPPALAQVRSVQRKVAGELHIAWWDWQQRMGGVCTAARWATAVPPLMRGDHVHFREPGGVIIARLLQDDLDRAAEAR